MNSLAEDCRRQFGVKAQILACDLGDPDFVEKIQVAVSGLEVNVVVYNAAFAPMGEFATTAPDDLLRVIDINVRGPVRLARALVPPMVERRRGAVILMSSLAGNQGTPRIATYAASKAFNRILAEGLWHELRSQGVQIVACCAGAIRTPGYASAAARDAPGTLDPDTVAEKAIRALGRGPLVVPGFINQLAAWVMGRLLPRRMAIGIMAGSTDTLGRARRPKVSS